jgi:hypothetical protein
MHEVALAESVLDESIGGAGIRHTQQRFRQHHQREAFLGGKREFAKHVLDAAKPVVIGSDSVDQARGRAVDARVLRRVHGGHCEQPGRDRAIVRGVGRREQGNGGEVGLHDMPWRMIARSLRSGCVRGYHRFGVKIMCC